MRRAAASKPIRTLLTGLIAAGLGLIATPAWAHGDISSATPEEGRRVRRAPDEVALVLAEPAARGSSLVVTDGCKEEVSGELVMEGDQITVPIRGGRPGKWSVKLRSISSVDGHVVRAAYAFTVAGSRDCSADVTDPEPDETDDANTSSRPPIANLDDDGTSFPVVPFALGTVALVGLAVALRRPKA